MKVDNLTETGISNVSALVAKLVHDLHSTSLLVAGMKPRSEGARPFAPSVLGRKHKSRCNVTDERQHARSTLRPFLERWTSLASGIIPTLESRLTLQEKWVLDQRFLGLNHIKRPRRVCRTTCGRQDDD